MTRKEILLYHNVNEHGIIKDPGKFEGEMLYAPHFYDAYLNGDGDIDDDLIWFEVDDEDRAEFPELENANFVSIYEDDQGFIYIATALSRNYDHYDSWMED